MNREVNYQLINFSGRYNKILDALVFELSSKEIANDDL
jgi:hypothetical protein